MAAGPGSEAATGNRKPKIEYEDDDPLPLHRVLIPPELVAAELKKARGVLRHLPYAEFQAKVRAAALAARALRRPPCLVESHYRASLRGTALDGKGVWTVTNPSAAGILDLPDLNLALSHVKPGVPDIILGELGGKDLGLLVNGTGKHTVVFDWTARAEAMPEGLRFRLRVPACPVASLELTLAGDRLVTVQSGKEVVLTRLDREGEQKDSRWQIRFPGRVEVDLLVHPTGGPAPLVMGRLRTEQELFPGHVDATFEFRVRAWHSVVRKLYFACDAALRPYDVRSQGGGLRWELHESRQKGVPNVLAVELREPVLIPRRPPAVLTVRAVGPLAAHQAWTSPAVQLVKAMPWGRSRPGEPERPEPLADERLVPAVPRGETLGLRVHPGVRLDGWHAGDFHLRDAGPLEGGGQRLDLAGSGPDLAGHQQRPGARVRTRGCACLARPEVWWRVGPGGSDIEAQISYEVTHGRLFRLRAAVPAGWTVEKVEVHAAGRRRAAAPLLRGWSLGGAPRPVLVVELQRPLKAAGPWARLAIRLRSPWAPPAAGRGARLDFPAVQPLDADLCVGALAVDVAPLYRATVGDASVPACEPEAAGIPGGPWPGRVPTFYFPFRGRGPGAKGTAVTGRLVVRPHAPRFRARCMTDVVLGPDRAAADVRLDLRPEGGGPKAIDLWVSSPVGGPWRWQGDRGATPVRATLPLLPGLLGLSARGPLEAACAAATPAGQWWRLVLRQPLQRPLTLKARFPLSPPPGRPGPRPVPLFRVPAAEASEGEVTLYLAGTDLVRVTAKGLREVPAVSKRAERVEEPGEAALPWRKFRYGQALSADRATGPAPSLRLSQGTRILRRPQEEVIDPCRLDTYVEPDGRLLHRLAFQVWNWRRRTLTIRLPAGATPLAVQAYGRSVTPLALPGGKDATVLELPVATGVPSHRFTLLYASDGPAPQWQPWLRLEAPDPKLPVRPLAFRRTWHLGPGEVPLRRAGLCRLPGTGAREGAGWAAFDEIASGLAHAGKLEPQRQLVTWAGTDFDARFHSAHRRRLGDTLYDLALIYLRGQTALVLDAAALRAADLTPASPWAAGAGGVPHPVWEAWGLVYVPCRGAALLTTKKQLRLWQPNAETGTAAPASVREAVAEAAAYGQDASGRFLTLGEWLAKGGGAAGPDARPRPGIQDGRDEGISLPRGGDWTVWEPIVGVETPEVLWVVRRCQVRILGMALAGALVAGAWLLARQLSARRRFRLLLLASVCCGLALIWLPAALKELAAWPALAAAAAAACWYLRLVIPGRGAAAKPESQPPKRQLPRAVTASGLLGAFCLLHGAIGLARTPDPATVLLLPGPSEAPERLSALVRPELLDRLDRLAHRRAQDLRGAVLLGAEYRGRVNRGAAEFDADFQVYCFGKEATLALPLGDVVLKARGALGEPAFFAGRPAYPVALPRKQTGYAVPLRVEEPGAYTLNVRFATAVARAGDDRELRFTVPRVAQNRLTVALPRGARGPADEAGWGAQEVQAGPRLEADLGRAGEVRVRWHRQRPPGPAALQVQEAYLWDLAASGARLSGVLQFTVRQGTVARLDVGLAEGIEVRSVEVRRWPLPPSDLVPGLLNRAWQVTGRGEQRQLEVELNRPVSGGVQMVLELVPRGAVRPGVVPLVLPMPRHAQALAGLLAYRVRGLEPGKQHATQSLGVTPVKQSFFAQKWRGAVPHWSDAGPPALAYSFRRTAAGPAVLSVTLLRPAVYAHQEISWRVGRRGVDLEAATATLTAPGRGLVLVEWDAPGVAVVGVSGPQLRHWTWDGSRVQAWLKGPCAQAELRLSGWLAHSPAPAPPYRLALPCLRLSETRAQTTTLRVLPADGLDVGVVGPPPAGGTGGARSLSFTTTQANYQAAVEVRPPESEVRVLTRAQVRDRSLVFTARLHYAVTRGELRRVRIRLKGWPGAAVLLDARHVARRREDQPGPAERLWTLYLRPGVRSAYAVRLTGELPLDPGGTVLLPEVRDAGAGDGLGRVLDRGRWLEVDGQELAAEEVHGLAGVGGPPATLAAPSRARPAARRHTWLVAAGDWRLRLRPHLPAGTSARLLWTERTDAVTDGRRWVHQAVYRLLAAAGTDLHFQLPAGALLLGVWVDHVPEIPRRPRAGEIRLALPGEARLRSVRLSWSYPPDREFLDRPRLELPRPVNAGPGSAAAPCLWTLYVPAGYHLEPPGGRPRLVRPATAAGHDLRRAAALLEFSTLLAGRLAGGAADPDAARQLQEVQERFLHRCRLAEARLTLPTGPAADGGPRGLGLTRWLGELRRENDRLLRPPPLAAIAARARDRAGGTQSAGPNGVRGWAGPEGRLWGRGLPHYWVSDSAQIAPEVRLGADAAQRRQRSVAFSGLILLAVAAAWGLSYVPRLRAVLQMTWPEQVMVLGWLVWQAFGFPGGGVLLLAGAAARLYLLARGLAGLLRRPAAAPGGGSPAAR
jgi:hypothetical protein